MSAQVFKCALSSDCPVVIKKILADHYFELSQEDDPHSDKLAQCNLLWKLKRQTWKEMNLISKGGRVNHFPHSHLITRKESFHREMAKLALSFGNESELWSFIPETFSLPFETSNFLKAVSRDPNIFWIFKPSNSSQGKEIIILSGKEANAIELRTTSIIQRYIPNPLLVEGFKFDIRFYVLVTSLRPFRVFFYPDGIVRFCTKKYDKEKHDDLYRHLTNCTINKTNEKDLDVLTSTLIPILGSVDGPKVQFSQFWTYLEKLYGKERIENCFRKIKAQIVLSLLPLLDSQTESEQFFSFSSKLSEHSPEDFSFSPICFELFGFDVILDEELRSYILEVNFSPSLGVDCHTDENIKVPMLHSLFSELNLGLDIKTSLEKNAFVPLYPFEGIQVSTVNIRWKIVQEALIFVNKKLI